jgi:hypothetical protein
MRRRVSVGVTTLLTAVLLAGCGGGGDDTGGLPTLGPESSGSSQNVTTAPEETPTAPPSTPVTTGPTSPSAGPPEKTVAVHRRTVVATKAEQKAAADAFLQYTVVRLLAFNRAAVDLDALARVASGQAFAVVKGQVTELQSKKWHTIGELWVDIPAITVKGTTATLRVCMDNTTIDVDKAGKPVEPPVPYYAATATLKKAGGQIWVVDNVAVVQQRCR